MKSSDVEVEGWRRLCGYWSCMGSAAGPLPLVYINKLNLRELPRHALALSTTSQRVPDEFQSGNELDKVLLIALDRV